MNNFNALLQKVRLDVVLRAIKVLMCLVLRMFTFFNQELRSGRVANNWPGTVYPGQQSRTSAKVLIRRWHVGFQQRGVETGMLQLWVLFVAL